MAIAFNSTSNFNIKLKSNSAKKVNKTLNYNVHVLFLKIIEYLII